MAAFRIVFGLLILWEVLRYWTGGRIERYYIDVKMTFPYEFFSFIHPLPGNGMYGVFLLMAVGAVFLAVGFLTRYSAALLFLLYTYVFLIDKTQYNNHYYLISLLLFLMIFVAGERCWSVDRWLAKTMPRSIPAWNLALLRFQWVVVYFYAGVAKLNVDWLAGQPIARRLHALGGLYELPATAFFFAYGGLLFDLCVGPMLLWKPTRKPALLACLCFHLTNAWQLTIGVFPWLGIAGLILFVDEDWLARVIGWKTDSDSGPFPLTKPLLLFLGLYVAIQLLVPLRHWLYPGDVAWTERGHRFSWRMKLRSKSGKLDFVLITPDKKVIPLDTDEFLTRRQFSKMKTRPDMILQFAHSLDYDPDWRLEARSEMSLNSRLRQVFIKPDIDLRKVSWNPTRPVDWLVPLTVPRTPVSSDFERFRRALAGSLALVLSLMLPLAVRRKTMMAFGYGALLLAGIWPLGLGNSAWTTLGAWLVMLIGIDRQKEQRGRPAGWMLLMAFILFVLGLTGLIAPFE